MCIVKCVDFKIDSNAERVAYNDNKYMLMMYFDIILTDKLKRVHFFVVEPALAERGSACGMEQRFALSTLTATHKHIYRNKRNK